MPTNNRPAQLSFLRSVTSREDPITWPRRQQARYGWTVTFVLFFFMMLNWADKAVLGLAAVPIMRDLQIGPEAFGMVSSAMFVTFVLVQVVAAPFMDRIPSRWLLVVLCLMWSLAQAPIILFASLPALWVGRILLGVGEGPSSPAILHAIYKWFPEHKRAGPGAVVSVGAMIGLVIFAPVLAWMIERFGWLSAFVVLALAGIVLAAVWWVVGKEGPFGRRFESTSVSVNARAGDVADNASATPQETLHVPLHRSILTPTWILTLCTSFFAYWTFSVALAWAPAYFQTVLHLPGPQAGSLLGLIAACGTVATLAVGGISQQLQRVGVTTRGSRARVLGIAALIAGGSLLGALLVHDTWLVIILMAIGFGTAPALFPLALLITSELTTASKHGANLSFANAAQTSAGIVAPTVTGFIIGGASTVATGYTTAFMLAAGLTVLSGAACVVFVDQQRDRRRLGLESISPSRAHAAVR